MAAEQAPAMTVDAGRLAIGGASAGAGLAANLDLLARDRGEVPACFQLLIYPMIDDRHVRSSQEAGSDHHIWSRASNLFGWQLYLGREPGGEDVPYHAAPMRAQDVSGLPPTFISVGELDLFLDEDITHAQRQLRAGYLRNCKYTRALGTASTGSCPRRACRNGPTETCTKRSETPCTGIRLESRNQHQQRTDDGDAGYVSGARNLGLRVSPEVKKE